VGYGQNFTSLNSAELIKSICNNILSIWLRYQAILWRV